MPEGPEHQFNGLNSSAIQNAFRALFPNAILGANNGQWFGDVSGSTSSSNTGPGSNNALNFAHTETSQGANPTEVLYRTNGTCDMAASAVPDEAGRILRIRACVQGRFGDGTEGLQILSRADDSDTFEEAGFIHGWAFSNDYDAGGTVTDENGATLTFVANGGWVDFDIPIPDGDLQVRLVPHYIFSGNIFSHDISVREMQWRWPDAVPAALSGQPLSVDLRLARVTAGQPSATLAAQALATDAALAEATLAATTPPTALAGQPLAAHLALGAATAGQLTTRLAGQDLAAHAALSEASTAALVQLVAQPLAANLALGPATAAIRLALAAQALTADAALAEPSALIVGPPDAPSDVQLAEAGYTTLDIEWTRPADDGGAPITGYEVRVGTGQWIATGTAAERHTVTGLRPTNAYLISVRALNRYGAGSAASATLSTLTATTPEAPTHLDAREAGGTAVEITWQPPAFTGGVPITGYEVCVIDVAGRAAPFEETPTTATSVVLRGLARHHRYGFRVRARNSVGAGDQSPIVYAVPADVPVQPILNGRPLPLADLDRQSLVVRLGDTDARVTVAWNPTAQAWFGTVESPVNTFVARGRRLVANRGLLEGAAGDLAGDLVVRAIDAASAGTEPGRDAWATGSHVLLWAETA